MTQPGEQEVIIGSMPPFLHPLDELVGLFHDGQVGGEVGVETPCQSRGGAEPRPSCPPRWCRWACRTPRPEWRGWTGRSERRHAWSGRPGRPRPCRCRPSRPGRRSGRPRCTGRRRRRRTSSRFCSKAQPMWVLKPRSLAPMTPTPCTSWRRPRRSGGTGCTCCCRAPCGRRYRRSRTGGLSPVVMVVHPPRRSPCTASAARSCRCARRRGTSCRGWKGSAPGWFCGTANTLGVLVMTSIPSVTG